MPRDEVYQDAQGVVLDGRPGLLPMPDGPTCSCCPSDTEYETGPVKGWKRQLEDEDPRILLKHARRQKGKWKSKGDLGIKEKGVILVGSHVGGASRSSDIFGESVNVEEACLMMEEACLIDAAIAGSVATNCVESMLRTQSAGAGPSTLPTRFKGTREPQQARPFTGFSPTVNLESHVLVTGKFCPGTMLVGGPLPPLVSDDDKEELGEVERLPVSMPDYSVLDRADLFCMEENPWDSMEDLRGIRGRIPKI